MSAPISTARHSDLPVAKLFLERWSPRAYDAAAMPNLDLLTVLEAARWAPSAYNVQPWRFLYSHRGDMHWQAFLGLLDQFNQGWARHASALIFVLSDTIMPARPGGAQRPSRSHSFDAGAAWAQLALQATLFGYHAHAMAGVDYAGARDVLAVPERFHIEIAVAIGRRGDSSILPEELQVRESPSPRHEMNAIAFAGRFPQGWSS